MLVNQRLTLEPTDRWTVVLWIIAGTAELNHGLWSFARTDGWHCLVNQRLTLEPTDRWTVVLWDVPGTALGISHFAFEKLK